MPMLRFKGISKEALKTVSTQLVDDLHRIIECPRDYFILELIEHTFIFDGEEVSAPSIIEVAWFDRGQLIQDQSAKCITQHFAPYTDDLEIYFIPINESNYYENGIHF